jgi:hypothetical protein
MKPDISCAKKTGHFNLLTTDERTGEPRTENRELETGNWKLETGNWKLETGN